MAGQNQPASQRPGGPVLQPVPSLLRQPRRRNLTRARAHGYRRQAVVLRPLQAGHLLYLHGRIFSLRSAADFGGKVAHGECGPFSLTLTLSRWERESPGRPLAAWKILRPIPRRPSPSGGRPFPLSQREGRGEGERPPCSVHSPHAQGHPLGKDAHSLHASASLLLPAPALPRNVAAW